MATDPKLPNSEIAELGDGSGEIRRVLIVGISGYLGSSLAIGLRDEFEVLGTYHENPTRIEGVTSFPLNCTSGGEIIEGIKRYRPDAVLYCAGLADDKACVANPPMADSLHFKAPTAFFKILPVVLRFVYFSSHLVYQNGCGVGKLKKLTGPFTESDVAAPENVFGRTKFHGETTCTGHKKYTAVFRLGQVFGENFFADRSTNIVNDWIRKWETGTKTSVATNVQYNPIYIGDVVRAVKLYLKNPPREAVLYNYAGTETCSEATFAETLCESLGYDSSKLIKSVENTVPVDTSLSSQKFSEKFQFQAQNLKDSALEFSERLRTGHTRSWK